MTNIIIELIGEKFSQEQIRSLWNAYCECSSKVDSSSRIYSVNDDMDTVLADYSPKELVRMVANCTYNIDVDDEYFTLDRKDSELYTYNSLDDESPLDYDLLAEWYCETEGKPTPNSVFHITPKEVVKAFCEENGIDYDEKTLQILSPYVWKNEDFGMKELFDILKQKA